MYSFNKSMKFSSFVMVAVLLAVFALAPVHTTSLLAQDEMPVVCDSTLAVLLLVAEHDYDYLSSMMDSDMEMPNLDLGQYDGIIHDTMAMMMEMMDNMTDEEMAAAEEMDSMMEPMMMMDTHDILAQYAEDMGMEMDMDMTTLTPGDVDGEDPLCASVRADVEHFLVAHIVAESEAMMMDEG